jgi:hypothetical protein
MATRPAVKKTKAGQRAAKMIKKPAKRVQQAVRTSTAQRATPAGAMDDYEGVRQVVARYCYALDHQRFDELGGLFHRNAVFSVSFEGGQKHIGRETIQAWYEQFSRQRSGEFNHVRHKIFEPMINFNGTTAVSSTYFDAEVVENGTIWIAVGRYDDTLVKERGQWFFKERTINVFYRYSLGSPQEW